MSSSDKDAEKKKKKVTISTDKPTEGEEPNDGVGEVKTLDEEDINLLKTYVQYSICLSYMY